MLDQGQHAAGILRFPPHRFFNNLLRRESSEIMEYKVDNLGMRKSFRSRSTVAAISSSVPSTWSIFRTACNTSSTVNHFLPK